MFKERKRRINNSPEIANSGIRGESRGRRVTGWVLKGQGLSLFGQLGLL